MLARRSTRSKLLHADAVALRPAIWEGEVSMNSLEPTLVSTPKTYHLNLTLTLTPSPAPTPTLTLTSYCWRGTPSRGSSTPSACA